MVLSQKGSINFLAFQKRVGIIYVIEKKIKKSLWYNISKFLIRIKNSYPFIKIFSFMYFELSNSQKTSCSIFRSHCDRLMHSKRLTRIQSKIELLQNLCNNDDSFKLQQNIFKNTFKHIFSDINQRLLEQMIVLYNYADPR